MKKPLFLFLLSLPSFNVFANDHTCSIKDTIFFSYTVDHEKVVELCKVNEGYRFIFGVPNRPEVILYRNKYNIMRLNYNERVFKIINGGHNYTVIEGKEENENSRLIIMQRTDFLLSISLDSNSDDYINKTFGWVI